MSLVVFTIGYSAGTADRTQPYGDFELNSLRNQLRNQLKETRNESHEIWAECMKNYCMKNNFSKAIKKKQQ